MRTNPKQFLLLFSAILFSFSIAFSTNPVVTKWTKNISEGEGEAAVGFTEENSEIFVDGNSVHVLWITNENSILKIYYRKSDDGGKTWQNKQMIFSGIRSGEKANRRFYVSGNYVHIALINPLGYANDEILYFRSSDGGQTFEDSEVIYKTGYWYLDYLKLSGDGAKINVAAIINCSGCGGVPTPILFHSDDNGETFVEKDIPDEYNGNEYSHWDAKTVGSNIYFYFMKVIGPGYNYDYELYFVSSNDDGETFSETLISVPAQSGLHHTLFSFDTGWGYAPKIAAEGNRVAMIWSGLNAQNEVSIFVGVSDDRGNSFTKVKEVATSIVNLQTGLETLTINGDEIYACFNTNDSKVHVAKSVDGGSTFGDAYTYTQPNNEHPSGMWGPKLLPNPSGTGAVLVCAGPTIGFLSPGIDDSHPAFVGNFTLGGGYVSIATDEAGYLHVAYRAGSALIGTGGFTDFDTYYKKFDLNFEPVPGASNYAVQFDVVPLAQAATAFERFDNMVIPFRKDFVFTDAMSVELWVKPEGDDYGRILTQLAGNTWNAWNPESFQIWVNDNNPTELVCGLWTDAGPFVVIAPNKLSKGYWSHIAITYSNNGEADNYKLFVNGQLAASTTATGALLTDFANWYLGATHDYSNSNNYNFIGRFDELRFWKKALTQAEIQSRLFEELNGDEENLAAYFNFNAISEYGEVADVSGNGNTGYLMYLEELVENDIEDVGASFTYTQLGTDVYFEPLPTDAESYTWDFGDGSPVNTDQFAFHKYANPGVFNVCLTVGHGSNQGAYCETIVVEGIEKIYPTSAGNYGGVTLFVYGGGFQPGNNVTLRRSGFDDIVAINTSQKEGVISALFELSDSEIGVWDVVVEQNGSTLELPASFTITDGSAPAPWVTVSGRSAILLGAWTSYTVTFGNSGNNDAYGVPLWLAITDAPGIEVTLINIKVEPTKYQIENGWGDVLRDSVPVFVELDSLFGQPFKHKLYGFYFPIIQANSTQSFTFRVKTTNDAVPVKVKAWVNPPYFQSPMSDPVTGCIAFAAAKFFAKTLVGFFAPPGLICLTSAAQYIFDYQEEDPPLPGSDQQVTKSSSWAFSTNLLECAASFIPGSQIIKATAAGVTGLIVGGVEGLEETDDCHKGYQKVSLHDILCWPVYSLDPNEKYGPPGYGTENFIGPQKRFTYEITFENVATATAPAHEVVVVDTLDANIFDLESLTFGTIQIGDSTFINPLPGFSSFSEELDLRPQKDLIVRVSADLDKTTGILKWRFNSLNITTRQPEEDPFLGFLPPNLNAPEGEGSVSFTVSLKNEPLNGQEITNEALIFFDYNPPIQTDLYKNIFDMMAPESQISGLSAVSNDTLLQMEVSGSDEGSQIRAYEIFVSVNDSAYHFAQTAYESPFYYDAEFGNTYAFYSIAVDSVGNREDIPAFADVETLVTGTNAPPQQTDGFSVFPVPTKNELIIQFSIDNQQFLQSVLYDLNGNEIKPLFEKSFLAGKHTVSVLLDVPPGIYVVRIKNEDYSMTEKIVVKP